MSKELNDTDCKIGDKVCFKSEKEKENYQKISKINLDDVIYGVITYMYEDNVIEVNWINHKGIAIEVRVGVYYSRLKFYDE